MTVNDITELFGLYADGFIIGALFSGLAFVTGYFVNFFLSLVKSA